jgi:AAA+ ATPase superfamily predicted ATPase
LKSALELAGQRLPGRGPFILALDEFQWIAEASPELPSVIQELWDRVWSRSGRILLVLCGSYIGFMEREVLGRRSPLFGRRTAQLLLRPFNHLDAAGFHPRLCRESLPLLYLREGGRAPFTVGEYWDAGVQVDVVGLRQDHWTDLGECKRGEVASLPALAAELEKKVRRYPNARKATIGRRLFVSKSSGNHH